MNNNKLLTLEATNEANNGMEWRPKQFNHQLKTESQIKRLNKKLEIQEGFFNISKKNIYSLSSPSPTTKLLLSLSDFTSFFL